MIVRLHTLVFGLALVGLVNAACAQTPSPAVKEALQKMAEQERTAKENGTWIYPWVLNGRVHCPLQATPRGSLEEKSQWTSRNLHLISLFVPERTEGISPNDVKIELACSYAGGYELVAALHSSCRFSNATLPTERISETLPKSRNGFTTSCNLYDHSFEDCEIKCAE